MKDSILLHNKASFFFRTIKAVVLISFISTTGSVISATQIESNKKSILETNRNLVLKEIKKKHGCGEKHIFTNRFKVDKQGVLWAIQPKNRNSDDIKIVILGSSWVKGKDILVPNSQQDDKKFTLSKYVEGLASNSSFLQGEFNRKQDIYVIKCIIILKKDTEFRILSQFFNKSKKMSQFALKMSFNHQGVGQGLSRSKDLAYHFTKRNKFYVAKNTPDLTEEKMRMSPKKLGLNGEGSSTKNRIMAVAIPLNKKAPKIVRSLGKKTIMQRPRPKGFKCVNTDERVVPFSAFHKFIPKTETYLSNSTMDFNIGGNEKYELATKKYHMYALSCKLIAISSKSVHSTEEVVNMLEN